ncbi:lipoyl(octanoyl) transferase LipB [Candidatus Woesearchaeota archaeon]|nr:lipoyl(octanoyl) transferase LipB [Candidatus Woesearchaeota archaeon]
MSKEVCWVVDCGEISYSDMIKLQKTVASLRLRNIIPDVLLLAEHEPTITLGSRASESQLRIMRRVLEQRGIPVVDVQRQGGIMFYMPGQVAGYAIRSLGVSQVESHVAGIEETLLKTISDYKINAKKGYESSPDNKRIAGIWTLFRAKECKLASIGIDVFQRISMHGFALNVNTQNEYFDFLDMHGKGATSMQKVLDRPLRLQEVKEKLVENFSKIFNYAADKKSYLSFLDAVRKVSASVSDE